MSQTCLTLAQLLADTCPRHVLHWLSLSRPMHVPDMSYSGTHLCADAMSQTCLTLTLVWMLMLCPRHGLTLALITSPRLDADAVSQTWSYIGSHNMADACPKHVLH
ncbi:hypothetical protein F383_32618 [Gossypium arboreum]|uniref:Uncharacterized protein n=1 Tax=Gossypium arboreum TaxID=29729 RepID=A0A0B0MUX1_GOSAR|nr:hypothetical protein F383_32618 [Gossypium arboreum]